jgi:NAD(P)-dependent dehydrogenase (short-subunit alcohol dehydrogenase family)
VVVSKLRQHVEDMRTSVTQTASNEQSLVKSLGDALNHVDQQLLRDIRKVAAEHEARRAVIFNELQALACNIGVFQPAPEVTALPAHSEGHHPYFPAVGDWRQATRNLTYQDEFEAHLNVNPNGTIGGNGTGRH